MPSHLEMRGLMMSCDVAIDEGCRSGTIAPGSGLLSGAGVAVLKRQLLATPSPLLGDASELAEVWHLTRRDKRVAPRPCLGTARSRAVLRPSQRQSASAEHNRDGSMRNFPTCATELERHCSTDPKTMATSSFAAQRTEVAGGVTPVSKLQRRRPINSGNDVNEMARQAPKRYILRLFTSKGQLPSGVPWAAFGVDRSSVGGPRVNAYITAFLAHRTAEISYGQLSSPSFSLGNKGTPQGSVLSPLLFNITLFPLARALRTIPALSHAFYANDITLWVTTGNLGDIETTLQAGVGAVATHARSIGLSCSPAESELLLLLPRGMAPCRLLPSPSPLTAHPFPSSLPSASSDSFFSPMASTPPSSLDS
ncbi:hypothetical protein HPB49_023703 [Dermacentor silvarum]|uniref:Uncharacterized protein n=1 Tax=Dermacentor silvarum TaxID=543639 RepID=A0ACB8D8Y9_DERSI|nr:hypothetical protein HPB49_023703 [Dermacentor silvarum]